VIHAAVNQAEGGPASVSDQLAYCPFPKPGTLPLGLIHPRDGIDE
jgi:hypothetical protein